MTTETLKRNTPVLFRTRTDRPVMTGKVQGHYNTVRGKFLRIRGTDGKHRNVRPGYVSVQQPAIEPQPA